MTWYSIEPRTRKYFYTRRKYFCHLQKIYLIWKTIMDTATKTVLDALKTVSKKVVDKATV